MKIESIKQIEQLVKLCRKTGVSKISVDGVVIELGDEPTKPVPQAQQAPAAELKDTPIYTDEEILNWSVNVVG